jgi:hypothetical protein
VAATQAKTPAAIVMSAPAPPALTSGMVVSIEPESGRLVMPSADEMARLSAAERTGPLPADPLARLSAAERTGLLRTSAGLSQISGPGGAIGVDLQGRFMEFTVVRLDLDGRLHFLGINDAPALMRLLDPRTPAPTPAHEEK